MKDKITKVEMRLKLQHPGDTFYLQGHAIKKKFETYDLNEKELAEFKTKGPQTWLELAPEVKPIK